MNSYLNQYIIDQMTRSYKIVCIVLLCMVRYIFFGFKVITRLIGLIYENIAKMANKIFNISNHLKNSVSHCQMSPDNVASSITLGNFTVGRLYRAIKV